MYRIHASLRLFCTISLLAPLAATAVNIDTVPVGNAGNGNDPFDGYLYGRVAYNYRIGTYEVTNAQYAEFLNAKAGSDPSGLYNTNMSDPSKMGGITRSGEDGSYTYATIAGRDQMPVNHVSWYDAIRFANWLNNGQGNGDTESGAYTLDDETATPSNGPSIARNPGAKWFLTSENEWYKAAYHKNDGVTSNYFAYPTRSDVAPNPEPPPGGSNSANYGGVGVVGDLTNVGAYTASGSPYGTFDQGGNLYEWNEALIGGSFRSLRGGDFHNVSGGLLSSDGNFSSVPSDDNYLVGFRVATVPEPSTLMLAAMGLAIGLLGWKRCKGH